MGDYIRLVVGDASKFWELHDGKPWASVYGILKVFECIMRSFAQVCFANNPWSGVLVFAGLLTADPLVALGAILATVSALCMSRILDQPDSVVVSGLQCYCAVLVGSVTVSLFPLFFEEKITIAVWVGIVAMAAFSVCIGIGLGVLLSPNQLPVYTLPFNITTSLLFLSLQSYGMTSAIPIATNATEVSEEIEWIKVFEGVLKSSGQVYAVDNVYSSIIILIALLINSPFLALMSLIGGLLSTLMGLFLTTAPYTSVYAGVWGYNGFLSAGCIAFFVFPNFSSALIACLNAVFTAMIHVGLLPIMQANNLPVFTFPFCLTSLIFLALVENVPGLKRVSTLTYPEEHCWRSREEARRARERKSSNAVIRSPMPV